MKFSNILRYKHLLSFFFVCGLTPAFCQDKKEIEDKVTTIFMNIVGKYYYEADNEYGEAEKVSGYQWATEIKDGNLIFAASVEIDTRPLSGKDFSAKSSYDVIYYFPLKYYDRIMKNENGFTIISNRNSSCKRVKKNIEFKDGLGEGKPFKPEDEVKYFGRFDFNFLELSEEDVLSLHKLLKQLNGSPDENSLNWIIEKLNKYSTTIVSLKERGDTTTMDLENVDPSFRIAEGVLTYTWIASISSVLKSNNEKVYDVGGQNHIVIPLKNITGVEIVDDPSHYYQNFDKKGNLVTSQGHAKCLRINGRNPIFLIKTEYLKGKVKFLSIPIDFSKENNLFEKFKSEFEKLISSYR